MRKHISFTILAIILGLNSSAGAAAMGNSSSGGDDPTVLGGTYRDETCQPSDPEQNCPFVRIDYGSDANGTQKATGALSGGDVVTAYAIEKRAIQLKSGDFVYELLGLGDSPTVVWIFIRKAQKLVNVENGLVLTRNPNE